MAGFSCFSLDFYLKHPEACQSLQEAVSHGPACFSKSPSPASKGRRCRSIWFLRSARNIDSVSLCFYFAAETPEFHDVLWRSKALSVVSSSRSPKSFSDLRVIGFILLFPVTRCRNTRCQTEPGGTIWEVFGFLETSNAMMTLLAVIYFFLTTHLKSFWYIAGKGTAERLQPQNLSLWAVTHTHALYHLSGWDIDCKLFGVKSTNAPLGCSWALAWVQIPLARERLRRPWLRHRPFADRAELAEWTADRPSDRSYLFLSKLWEAACSLRACSVQWSHVATAKPPQPIPAKWMSNKAVEELTSKMGGLEISVRRRADSSSAEEAGESVPLLAVMPIAWSILCGGDPLPGFTVRGAFAKAVVSWAVRLDCFGPVWSCPSSKVGRGGQPRVLPGPWPEQPHLRGAARSSRRGALHLSQCPELLPSCAVSWIASASPQICVPRLPLSGC